MIVADTNVIAYLLIRGEYTDAAEDLLAADSTWVAPMLWKSEFRNVIAVLRRAGAMSRTQAREYVRDAEQRMSSHEVDSELVLECVEESSLSASDCEFVALARQLRVPLVTADRRIVRAFPAVAYSLSR